MMLNNRLVSRLEEIDWDFTGSFSDSPFSPIHWQPGRFASQLPATFIGLFTQPGDVVLDPFAGSGTTLIEAQRLGRRSIGIELNPVSCTAARAKILEASAKEIDNDVAAIKEEARILFRETLPINLAKTVLPCRPSTVQAEKWYTTKVTHHLSLLWGLIQTFTDRKKSLSEAAFSAILLPVCREDRHWGYVCDNTRPITDNERDVLSEFNKTLDRLTAAYTARDLEITNQFGRTAQPAIANLICGDSREHLKTLPEKSIDLVFTSPPYYGVSDYIKAQRLSLEWLQAEIEPLRQKEIGARSKRHRIKSLNEYTSELGEIFQLIRPILRPGGICTVVIGQSAKRQDVLETLSKNIQELGFTLLLDLNRRITSQRRQAPSVKGEHVLVFQASLTA